MVSRTEKNKETITKIERENIFEKHKKIFIKIFKIISITLIIIMSFLLYSRYVSTYGLTIREYSNNYENLPKDYHGLKIIHISDIHYGSTTFKNQLNNMKNNINKLKPDIVVFSGDLIDKNYQYKEQDINTIIEILSKIDSTIGKYATEGNQDKEEFENIMQKSGFTILNNTSDLIYKNTTTPIYINGIGSSSKNNNDIPKAFEKNNKDIFTITIMHEPDNIDEILESYNVDIALAGHSHNGQVRLPFIGAIVKNQGAKKYYNEYYKINNTDLYISGGIGTSTLPFRLFNRPNINFYRLRCK